MITKDDFNIKLKKCNNEEKPSYIKCLLFKTFIKAVVVIILYLGSLIYIKQNEDNKVNFEKIVYNNSLSFAKIYNTYKKYLGDAIPFKNIFKDNTKVVSSESISYSEITKKENGYLLSVSKDYIVNSIYAGIIIKIENDDKYKNIITIQDKNGLNISYGNLKEVSVKIYDYVDKGELLGNCDNNLYLIFEKDGKYLSYEEYL